MKKANDYINTEFSQQTQNLNDFVQRSFENQILSRQQQQKEIAVENAKERLRQARQRYLENLAGLETSFQQNLKSLQEMYEAQKFKINQVSQMETQNTIDMMKAVEQLSIDLSQASMQNNQEMQALLQAQIDEILRMPQSTPDIMANYANKIFQEKLLEEQQKMQQQEMMMQQQATMASQQQNSAQSQALSNGIDPLQQMAEQEAMAQQQMQQMQQMQQNPQMQGQGVAIPQQKLSEDKKTKMEVRYLNITPLPYTNCGNCRNFISSGSCSKVGGNIVAAGWCEEHKYRGGNRE